MQKAEILPTVVQRNSLPDASREPGVTTPTAGVEVNASPAVATLEVTALGMMGAACTTNGTPTPDGAPTMAPTAAATQAATPEGKPTVVVTSEATSTARIEITQTPEPSNKPSMFEGLNFGVYGADQKTVGAVQGNAVEKALQAKQMGDYVVPVVSGAHETRVNTLYNPDFPDSPAGFSLDQTYLNTLFQANADKSGIVRGTLPNGQPVEQKGALWTTTVDGHEVVFNPVVISREGKQFGYPVLVEKGADKALYLVLVDEKGAPVSDPTPAFKTPGQMAAEAGYVGDANVVSSVALDRSGIMVVRGSTNSITEVNFTGTGVTLTEWGKTHEPDLSLLQSAETPYLATLGGKAEDLKLDLQLHDGPNGLFLVKADPKTGTPLLITTTGGTGERTWALATAKNVSESTGFNLSVMLGGYGSVNDYATLVAMQKNLFNSGTVFFGSWMWNQDGTTNLSAPESDARIGQEASMKEVLGANLFWANDAPEWMRSGTFTPDQMKQIMTNYLQQTVGRFQGKIDSWVVVNEYDHMERGADPYKKALGEGYVDYAFEQARLQDKTATLIYNDFFNETVTGDRYQVTKTIIDRLKAKDPNIGVGLQMHLNWRNPPDAQKVLEAMRSYGVPVYVTEFDVNMDGFTGTPAERERVQAEIYKNMMSAAVKSGVVKQFTVFGLIDRLSVWEAPGRFGGSPDADPLIFHDDFTPKQSYYGLLAGLLASE